MSSKAKDFHMNFEREMIVNPINTERNTPINSACNAVRKN